MHKVLGLIPSTSLTLVALSSLGELPFFLLFLALHELQLVPDSHSLIKWSFCPPFIFQSLLDDQGLAEVSEVAEQVLDAINKGFYKEATQLWGKAETVIEKVKTEHDMGDGTHGWSGQDHTCPRGLPQV